MKKTILVALILILTGSLSHAAWTVTASLDRAFDYGNGERMYVFKLDCTSDASSSGDIVLATQLKANEAYGASSAIREVKIDQLLKHVWGGVLYYVKYEPDGTATPTSESTITIDDETGALIFSEAVTTAATAQGWEGGKDTGDTFPPVTALTIAATTLANEKEAIIWIWIKR